MKIDSLDQVCVDGDVDWSADNDNWVNLTENNRLVSMMSIPARIKNLKYNNHNMINLGYLNQSAYNIMKKCMLAKGAACYIDTQEQELSYARLVIHINTDNLESAPEHMIVNISCEGLDGELHELRDIKFERSKQFKKRLKFNTNSKHTTNINNKFIYNYNIHLMDTETYNFKISAMYNDVKLKCYLNCSRSS